MSNGAQSELALAWDRIASADRVLLYRSHGIQISNPCGEVALEVEPLRRKLVFKEEATGPRIGSVRPVVGPMDIMAVHRSKEAACYDHRNSTGPIIGD